MRGSPGEFADSWTCAGWRGSREPAGDAGIGAGVADFCDQAWNFLFLRAGCSCPRCHRRSPYRPHSPTSPAPAHLEGVGGCCRARSWDVTFLKIGVLRTTSACSIRTVVMHLCSARLSIHSFSPTCSSKQHLPSPQPRPDLALRRPLHLRPQARPVGRRAEQQEVQLRRARDRLPHRHSSNIRRARPSERAPPSKDLARQRRLLGRERDGGLAEDDVDVVPGGQQVSFGRDRALGSRTGGWSFQRSTARSCWYTRCRG